jgi:hypothetical protein
MIEIIQITIFTQTFNKNLFRYRLNFAIQKLIIKCLKKTIAMKGNGGNGEERWGTVGNGDGRSRTVW